jgi:hypothetical protein
VHLGNGIIGSLLTALIGAVILLALVRLFSRGRAGPTVCRVIGRFTWGGTRRTMSLNPFPHNAFRRVNKSDKGKWQSLPTPPTDR